MIELDVIGTIYEQVSTGVDDEGVESFDSIPLVGWHINTPKEVAEWAAFKVTPTTPMRVFWGGSTFCYAFADEAEFEAEKLALFGEPETDV